MADLEQILGGMGLVEEVPMYRLSVRSQAAALYVRILRTCTLDVASLQLTHLPSPLLFCLRMHSADLDCDLQGHRIVSEPDDDPVFLSALSQRATKENFACPFFLGCQ